MQLVNAREINRRTDIPNIFVSQSTQGIEVHHKDFRTVRIGRTSLEKYKEALDSSQPFLRRVAAFFSATNKAGRRAKTIKDFLLIFLPYGKQVGNITELITELIIKPMAKTNTAPEKPKPGAQSKTIIVFALLLIVSVLQHFGIDLGLELSPDAAWLGTAAGIIGIVLRLVTGKPVDLTKLTNT